MQGAPFKYFAYGVAASEVEVDGFTGAYRLRRVDIVHDVGDSLSPLVDLGQIEGGFVQGAGWLTLEDLRWDTSDGPSRGRLATQAASTYKLPSFSEMPEDFHVTLLEQATEDGVGLRLQGRRRAAADARRSACARRCGRRSRPSGPPGTSVDLGSPVDPGGGVLGGRGGAGGGRAEAPGHGSARRATARAECGSADVLHWDRAGLAAPRAAPRAAPGVLVTRDDRARARPAGGRREDGGLSGQLLGHDRRRQPRGDRGRRARELLASQACEPETETTSLTERGAAPARRAVLRRRGDGAVRAAAPRCRPSRSSGSATSASSWPGSWPATTSTCTWSTRAPRSSSRDGSRRPPPTRWPGCTPPRGACPSWCSASCPPAPTS